VKRERRKKTKRVRVWWTKQGEETDQVWAVAVRRRETEQEQRERERERERQGEKRCFWPWDDGCFVVLCHCTRPAGTNFFFGLLSFFTGRLACVQRHASPQLPWHAADSCTGCADQLMIMQSNQSCDKHQMTPCFRQRANDRNRMMRLSLAASLVLETVSHTSAH
jgi:hypothetical protein